MKYLAIVLISLVLQTQCRSSLMPKLKSNETSQKSNRSARVHRVAYDEPSLLLTQNQDDYAKPNVATETIKSVNSLKDFHNFPKELDIYYQEKDSQEKEKHVKSRYEATSKLFPLSFAELKSDNEMKIGRSNAQYIDDMLIDVRNQIDRIRNYFQNFCRKDHAVLSPPEVKNFEKFSANQPRKLSIF